MGNTTKIEWCDHTASPWYGCSHVHTGCDHCYAETLSLRNPSTLGIWGDGGTRVKSKSFIDNLRKWNRDAAKQGVVESVFPSMCDPFEDRPELKPWREEMFAVADECQNIRLLLLTKRPENVQWMWPEKKPVGNLDPIASSPYGHPMRKFRPNAWIGTSVSDESTAANAIPELLKCRHLSPVLFLSAEPLVGPVDFDKRLFEERCDGAYNFNPLTGFKAHKAGGWTDKRNAVDWVIVGGESGPKARPCDVAWIRSIVDQCETADVACFVKQLGSNPTSLQEPSAKARANGWQPKERPDYYRDKKGGDIDEWPVELRVRQFPKATST